jgi:phosphoribosyl-AMP cyclohydrolase
MRHFTFPGFYDKRDHLKKSKYPVRSPENSFREDRLKTMQVPPDLKYDEKGLIPAIIQDSRDNRILMVAYMNAESLNKTVETRLTWFWSRSRQKFWQKGETSGNIQRVKEIFYDCDKDTLLIKVDQTGPACHTGEQSCFFRSFNEHGE